MRWLADECVHADVVRDLRAAGHDVLYAAEASQQTRDVNLADEALRDGRILLTEDKDFGDLAFWEAARGSGNRAVALSARAAPAQIAASCRRDRAIRRCFAPPSHGRRGDACATPVARVQGVTFPAPPATPRRP